MLAIFALVAFLLRYTVFGRMVTAIGSNEAAVRLAGVRTRWYKFAVYCISGAFCAVAGIISTSRTGVGSPIVGAGAQGQAAGERQILALGFAPRTVRSGARRQALHLHASG